MINRDDKLLSEAYSQMNEGIFDRMAAKRAGKSAYRDAGGKTGIKGLVQKGMQKVGQAAGMKFTPEAEAEAKVQDTAKQTAQVDQLADQYMVEIQKVATNLQKDLDKLGITNPAAIQDSRVRNIVVAILGYIKKTPGIPSQVGKLTPGKGQQVKANQQQRQDSGGY